MLFGASGQQARFIEFSSARENWAVQFDLYLLYWILFPIYDRGGGARSAVVTEQPVTDGGDSAEGLEKWVIAAEQGFNVFATVWIFSSMNLLYHPDLRIEIVDSNRY